MYVPAHFVETDRESIAAFIAAHGFCAFVTNTTDGPCATHLPMMLQQDGKEWGSLWGHIARANPQWRSGATLGLAIFSGPHSYISPTSYETDNAVPTWNYQAVHVTGQATFFDDQQELRRIASQLVEKYEKSRSPRWQWNDASDYSSKLLGHIVGVRLMIERVEASWKLSQNHPADRRRRIADALERESSEDAVAIATQMRAGMK
jgi:transcriptional regulator